MKRLLLILGILVLSVQAMELPREPKQLSLLEVLPDELKERNLSSINIS